MIYSPSTCGTMAERRAPNTRATIPVPAPVKWGELVFSQALDA